MKAGFGRSDITPRLGVQLAGYGPYRNRAAQEIVAPLQARALWLQHGRDVAMVVSLELCGLSRELDQRIRERVAQVVRLPSEQIFLAVTHTHSAPAVGGMYGWGEADPLYVETLPARVVVAAQAAKRSAVAVQWRHAEVPCEGLAVNRETDAGFALTANFPERIKAGWRPDHPEQTDPTVRVLAAYAGERLVGLLHHFGCHPVVYGEKTHAIHGDFVGAASAWIEANHPESVAVFLPGALGDINPKLNHRPPAESRHALRVIGRQYTRAIERGLGRAQPLSVDTLRVIRTTARFTRVNFTRAQIEARISALEKRFQVPGGSDQPFEEGDAPLTSRGMQRVRLAGLRAVLRQCRGSRVPNPPVALHGLRLGPLVLLGCGLEVYHRFQAPLVAASPHEQTWLVSLVGGMGYAPDRAARERAGYAADFIPLAVGELPFVQVDVELPRALLQLARRLASTPVRPVKVPGRPPRPVDRPALTAPRP